MTGDTYNGPAPSQHGDHNTQINDMRRLSPEAYTPIPSDAAHHGVSNIPRRLFIGRDSELALLDQAFAQTGEVVVHAVHGLGGIGKSALAYHWASLREERVRWRIIADTAAALEAGLAGLARSLKPVLAELPDEQQAERVVQWLAGNGGWLLVLDNVDDPADIADLLDRIPRGRVLITTRRAGGWHHHATTVRLGVLAEDDSEGLFVRVLTHDGPRDSEGAGAVCEEVGHLALAIEQAAAYCAQTGATPSTYLRMLTESPAYTFTARAEGTKPERTVARVWRLTLDRLADTPLAGDILRILAWYAPDRIPRDILTPLADLPEVISGVGRLLAYNMITDNGDGTLTVHRLVQALARTSDPNDPHRRAADIDRARDQATYLLAEALQGDVELPENWSRYRELLPHGDALTARHDADHDTARTADVLGRIAAFRQAQGAPAAAVPAFRRVVAARVRILGGNHPDTLVSRNNLAGAYESAGDLDRAIPLFERVLDNSERVLGDDHPQTLITRNNLARAYESAGDLDRAIPLFERVLDSSERVFGDDHPQTLNFRNNLAHTYATAGDLEAATDLFESVLADRESVLGDDHPQTLTSRNNLAGVYESAGDLEAATDLYESVLADRERVLGGDHPDTLSSRNNLAYAYHSAGDLGRALRLFERTLTDSERVLGGDHPDTLASRNNLAGAYQAAGDLHRATDLYTRLLADNERVLGGDHPQTL
ncbi:FxSxx-COOH system tetratricopeptide repeat protein, partial [Kitasatospora sp. NPDC056446]|uniref:FxSxx-COOH system tetratricopeptide repeat protein n=1 Tax=Kitasatospora sp. NPDC056446 TaxID=3345819 RepID=UPI0036CB5704